MSKPIRKTLPSAIAAIAFSVASAAASYSAESNRALIETLLENGHLTEEQAASLLEKEAAEEAKAQSSEDTRPAVTPSGLNFRDFRIRGRIEVQAGYTYADDEDGSEDYSTLEVRRVRLGASGTLLQNVRAQVEADLVPGADLSMRSAYLQWRQHEEAYIKFGYDRPPFGFERTTSSASMLTVERTHLTNTIISEDMLGLSVEGNVSPFGYGAGIYTNRDNANPNGDEGYLYNASGSLSLDDKMPDEQKLRFRTDLILNDDNAGLGTGDGPNFLFEKGFALSTHYGFGPFDFRAEYLRADSFDSEVTEGWYLMPSWYLTEKFQLVGRYERMKSEDDDGIRSPSRYARRAVDRRGDRFQAVYAGANYYFNGDAHRVMFGVELSELDGTPAGEQEAVTLYSAWRVLF